MRKLLVMLALSALIGCSAMPTPSPMAGTWKGDLNCSSSRLTAQDITIKLEDGLFPGLLNGEIENHAVRDEKNTTCATQLLGLRQAAKLN